MLFIRIGFQCCFTMFYNLGWVKISSEKCNDFLKKNLSLFPGEDLPDQVVVKKERDRQEIQISVC